MKPQRRATPLVWRGGACGGGERGGAGGNPRSNDSACRLRHVARVRSPNRGLCVRRVQGWSRILPAASQPDVRQFPGGKTSGRCLARVVGRPVRPQHTTPSCRTPFLPPAHHHRSLCASNLCLVSPHMCHAEPLAATHPCEPSAAPRDRTVAFRLISVPVWQPVCCARPQQRPGDGPITGVLPTVAARLADVRCTPSAAPCGSTGWNRPTDRPTE